MDCGGSIDPPSVVVVVVVSQSGAIDSRPVWWHALLQAMGGEDGVQAWTQLVAALVRQ